jgi:hypothetical protein
MEIRNWVKFSLHLHLYSHLRLQRKLGQVFCNFLYEVRFQLKYPSKNKMPKFVHNYPKNGGSKIGKKNASASAFVHILIPLPVYICVH